MEGLPQIGTVAIFTPIFSLPEDLMYEIFLDVCEGRDEPPLEISLVCKRWRTAVLDASLLWSNIRFNSPPPYHVQERRLQRSKSAPLNIIIDKHKFHPLGMPSISSIVKLLRPYVYRFGSLDIRAMKEKGVRTFFDELGHIEAPMLKSLILREVVDTKKWTLKPFGGHAPRLLTLHVAWGRTNWDPSLLCNLTTLTLGSLQWIWGISTFDILTTLAQTPRLTALTLKFHEEDLQAQKAWTSSQVKLEYLTVIHIPNGWGSRPVTRPWIESLLCGLFAPSLPKFPILISPTCLAALNNCPSFPLPSLQNLKMMHLAPNCPDELTMSLNYFPALMKNLHHLRALILRGDQLNETALHTLSTQLPCLDTLVIYDAPLSFEGLKGMVLTRASNPSLSALKKLSPRKNLYSTTGWPSTEEMEWIRAHVNELRC